MQSSLVMHCIMIYSPSCCRVYSPEYYLFHLQYVMSSLGEPKEQKKKQYMIRIAYTAVLDYRVLKLNSASNEFCVYTVNMYMLI